MNSIKFQQLVTKTGVISLAALAVIGILATFFGVCEIDFDFLPDFFEQEQSRPTEAPADEQNDSKGVSPALLAGAAAAVAGAAAVAAAAVAGAAVILKKRKK